MNSALQQVAAMVTGSETAMLIMVFGAVTSLVFGIVSVAMPGARTMEQRLGLSDEKRRKAGASLSYGDRQSRSMLRRLERSLAPQEGRKRTAVRRQLVQAGFYGPHAVTVYYALRSGLALLLPVVLLLTLPLAAGTQSIESMYTASMTAVAFGFLAPAYLLRKRIATRQRLVREAFPDTLDLLLVCVEAGLGLNAAMVRVSQELRDASPLICHHFRLVALEMQAGSSRETALRNLSERVGIEEVSALVTLLVQSEAMGVSVANTLRAYAADMRQKRLLRAEEHANKLPVRMVMPLGGMVMPAFLIMIVAPSAIRIGRAIVPALGG